MIRVNKTEEHTRTVVTVDGHLSGDFIAAVETCCAEAESNGKPVQLFLRDVATVDAAGQNMLRRLAAKGVRVFANGLYTSYLVESLVSNTGESHKPTAAGWPQANTPPRGKR